jgi:hypothetical protein
MQYKVLIRSLAFFTIRKTGSITANAHDLDFTMAMDIGESSYLTHWHNYFSLRTIHCRPTLADPAWAIKFIVRIHSRLFISKCGPLIVDQVIVQRCKIASSQKSLEKKYVPGSKFCDFIYQNVSTSGRDYEGRFMPYNTKCRAYGNHIDISFEGGLR